MLDIQNTDRMNRIIEALNYCKFDHLSKTTFPDKVYTIFKLFYRNNEDVTITLSLGATKGTLIFKEFGFVIKIPYKYADWSGEELQGATDAKDHWNYCEQEVVRYNEIKNTDIKDIFLEVQEFTTIKDYPIYIQELVKTAQIPEEQKCYIATEEDIEKLKNITTRNIRNISWEADVFALYGEETYLNLITKLIEKNISDLRWDNLGYRDEKPVIIDYAGFGDR